eukprot:comp22641_c3_seq2/m.34862 comp22641_c3_seq2/g.34862  ORF comp22641_c3_seq2/g.34862 comp22641_c3_seq2/m.34862 type:complete len:428 (+) comp22641_c3_seq2:498-1781(+)
MYAHTHTHTQHAHTHARTDPHTYTHAGPKKKKREREEKRRKKTKAKERKQNAKPTPLIFPINPLRSPPAGGRIVRGTPYPPTLLIRYIRPSRHTRPHQFLWKVGSFSWVWRNLFLIRVRSKHVFCTEQVHAIVHVSQHVTNAALDLVEGGIFETVAVFADERVLLQRPLDAVVNLLLGVCLLGPQIAPAVIDLTIKPAAVGGERREGEWPWFLLATSGGVQVPQGRGNFGPEFSAPEMGLVWKIFTHDIDEICTLVTCTVGIVIEAVVTVFFAQRICNRLKHGQPGGQLLKLHGWGQVRAQVILDRPRYPPHKLLPPHTPLLEIPCRSITYGPPQLRARWKFVCRHRGGSSHPQQAVDMVGQYGIGGILVAVMIPRDRSEYRLDAAIGRHFESWGWGGFENWHFDKVVGSQFASFGFDRRWHRSRAV